MAEFEYVPSKGFSGDSTPRVRMARFGDGYSQRVAEGINPVNQTWNLQFNSKPLAEAQAIDAFFRVKNGVASFTWVPPDEVTEVKVICQKWSQVYESHISRSITATFERVYE
jgi:phage-related protein